MAWYPSLPKALFTGLLVLLATSSGPAQAADLREGVEQLATAIAKSVPEGKQLRVAVTDLPDLQGVTSDLGRYIAERLTSRLIQSGRVRVIERRRLGQVLAELKFGMSDLVDPAKAKQLGRMAGVDALVVGSLSDLGNIIEVDARIIEVETSNMLLAATTTISKDDTVKAMSERGREMPAPPSAGASQPGAASTVSAPALALGTGKYQEFPQFRVEVASLQAMTKGRVALVLNYINKTQREFLITLPDWCSNTTTMNDDAGNEYRCERHTGIETPYAKPGGLTLPPGGSATASFQFDPPREMTKKGNRFSFNSTQLVRIPVAAGEPRIEARYSISILNIELR
jgi:TolB-like protein